MNIGVAEAKGDIVMRVDAHYEYPPHYASRLVQWLEHSGADNVGGIWILEPANDSAIARAIAIAVRHPFGVGNARYRLGSSESQAVDTVPFGCYRKEVFRRIGGFDEDLVRNQDIEFNMRLRRAGGEILLVPDVVVRGHARGTLTKIARMFFQYGYYNPLVIRKLGGRVTLRQTATPLFVAALVLSTILACWLPPMRFALAAILVAYAVPVLAASVRVCARRGLPVRPGDGRRLPSASHQPRCRLSEGIVGFRHSAAQSGECRQAHAIDKVKINRRRQQNWFWHSCNSDKRAHCAMRRLRQAREG